MEKQQILEFLKELKYSYHKNDKIYTQGSCFRLYKILKTIVSSAIPLYSNKDGHWITCIDDCFYDINGEIDRAYVVNNEYMDEGDNEVLLESAYVPTYRGQSVRYSKYKITV